MTVDIIVATYGNLGIWEPLTQRAVASATNQTVSAGHIHRVHGETLAAARNSGAAVSGAEWLIFLDADDELDPGYVEAVLTGTGDLRQPYTLGIVNGVEDDAPVLITPSKDLLTGNHMVIGTAVRRSLFETAGGFRELPALEDWDLWIRCWLAGGKIGVAPGAIYRVHVYEGSRNMSNLHDQVYHELKNEYMVQAQAQGLV